MVYVQGNDAVGEVSFSAWITTRPAEVLTNASGNCDWDDQFAGHISVQVESFTTPWAIGETIHIEATDGAGNVMNDADGGGNEYVEIVLTSEPYDWYAAYFISGEVPLPVTLTDFATIFAGEFVTISWTVESESAISKYNLYRGETAEILLYSVDATNESSQHTYTCEDAEVVAGETYTYWLESVGEDGSSVIYDPTSIDIPEVEDEEFDTEFFGTLNNATSSPSIKFSIGTGETATLTVYNIKGEVVETRNYSEGKEQIHYVTPLSSGVYFYKFSTENLNETRKMIILK